MRHAAVPGPARGRASGAFPAGEQPGQPAAQRARRPPCTAALGAMPRDGDRAWCPQCGRCVAGDPPTGQSPHAGRRTALRAPHSPGERRQSVLPHGAAQDPLQPAPARNHARIGRVGHSCGHQPGRVCGLAHATIRPRRRRGTDFIARGRAAHHAGDAGGGGSSGHAGCAGTCARHVTAPHRRYHR